jgi:glycine/D-amino acid oxidase-like deaminating enzyme
LREKKFVTFSNADFLDEHHFILKNNFSIKTQSFREMISNYLKENVNFQFGVEIKKIKFKAQKYRLFDQDRLITKADAVIYSGGFKSSESVLENSKILKPSIGQQDYIKSFDNFSMPYLGDMYLNKLNAKKFIIGSTYHDGVTDNRFQDSDSQILLDKTNKYFSGIELKKIGSWISTRSITPDRRPLFGEIKPNFFVSTGLGSSGFTISPFMAFLVAKKILGIDLFKLNQFSKIDITRFVSN